MKIPEIIMLPPNRVWRTYLGGKVLDSIQNNPNPADTHFPEDWIASTTIAVNKGREQFKEEGLSKIEFEGGEEILKSLMENIRLKCLVKTFYKIRCKDSCSFLSFGLIYPAAYSSSSYNFFCTKISPQQLR